MFVGLSLIRCNLVMLSVIATKVCTAIFCIATVSAGHIGRLRCQFPPTTWREYGRTCVCMRVVIGLTDVPATPDLKIGSISPAEMCSAIRMTSQAARTHYYPSLARGVFVRYA